MQLYIKFSHGGAVLNYLHSSKNDRKKVDRIIQCEKCKPKILLDVDMDTYCHNYVSTHNESM